MLLLQKIKVIQVRSIRQTVQSCKRPTHRVLDHSIPSCLVHCGHRRRSPQLPFAERSDRHSCGSAAVPAAGTTHFFESLSELLFLAPWGRCWVCAWLGRWYCRHHCCCWRRIGRTPNLMFVCLFGRCRWMRTYGVGWLEARRSRLGKLYF